ncbi:hypothetical protein EMIT047CA2_90126 [Pseudomonas soli]
MPPLRHALCGRISFYTFQSLWFVPGRPKGLCHCEAGFPAGKAGRILYWLIPTHVTFGRGHH